MPLPDRPVVRAKGFQKPAPEPKETAPKYAPSQEDAIPSAVCAPEPIVSKIAVEPELVINTAVETTIATEQKSEAPAITETPAVAGKVAATGGVRVSQAFAKSSIVATPTADAASVQAPSTSQAVSQVAALSYQPDNDPGTTSRAASGGNIIYMSGPGGKRWSILSHECGQAVRGLANSLCRFRGRNCAVGH